MNILQLLSVAYGGAKEERTAATDQLEQALESPQGPFHLVTLIRAGTDPALPAEQSLSALIYAKNYIVNKIDDKADGDIAQAVADIQLLLYDGIFRVPQTHQKVICTCISTLISLFQWNYVHKLMPEIICSRDGITADRSIASLRLLYVFVKRYKTPNLVPMGDKLEVCSALITALTPFLSYGDFQVDHMVLKIMECVVEAVLQVKRDHNIPANVFDDWFSTMVTYPERHFAAANDAAAGGSQKVYESYVRCVKRIAMISYSIMNDATKKKSPQPVAKHFLETHAQAFLEVWLRWLEYSATSKARSQHQSTDIAAMRYLKLCTFDENLYRKCLLPRLLQVVESSLFPYLCCNEEDEAVFANADDISDFAQYMLEGTFEDGEVSTRVTASNTIVAFIKGNKDYQENLLPQMLNVITVGLSREDTSETFPQTFGFLHLFSALRKYLRSDREVWNTQVAQFLVSFVAPRMLPTAFCIPLRFKATATYQRYVRAPMRTEDFDSFFQLLSSLLQDPDARIRLGVIDVMCSLVEMKRVWPYIKNVLVPLVEECLGFLNRVHTTLVPTMLLFLVENFSPELKPVLHKLGAALVNVFLATAFDMAHQEEAMDENALQDYWSADMSACALLDALENVLEASANDSEVFKSIMPDVVRLIRAVMERPDNYEFMEKTLGIWLIVVNNAKPITRECWDLLPLLFKSIDSGIGVDFFGLIEEVLDNYISNETAEYVQNTALMEATFGACEKILFQAVCGVSDKVGVPQLVEALLHQSKHCEALPGLFDAYLPRFVLLLLRALADKNAHEGEVRLRVWIVVAVMDAFYYNAAATLHIIMENGAYSQFFDSLFNFFRAAIDPPQKTKGKKKRRSGGKNADEEVVENLSLLTRKVLALGLISLLQYLTSTSCVTFQSSINLTSFQPYLRQTVALIQHCIFTNHTQLVPRCRISEEKITNIRLGVESEEAEEIDVEDEDVLGIDDFSDGGSNVDDCTLDSDDKDEDVEGGVDEGDNYMSPIDDVCEVTLFIQWMVHAQQALGDEFTQQLGHSVPLKTMEEYTAAEATARRYRELVRELNSAMEEDYKVRSAAAAQTQ
ncbi:hypothetical protein, conserved [Trypanosoma brucei gambiense DAL972]|uniref:Importin N-terminal domain-containing protein n=2 Tax=Trypanosoma brucei TaxID=5691 RepID=C9ZLG1_TRYB9|nr:hypothetical protein, conserved [Trypanosoma brucei gambiense DAL972]RHW73411.1 hypothetical protein DPX39_030045700 [Trypanosoma brucei equiperdum]CBH10170.1 hypothetical protein, conserved [Trypanosoma brucei gambiense DAL972]|eukprot:XP_011772460.1 hypothetical protein, conserved [Trypanosoma brucei gambiense DAL972]